MAGTCQRRASADAVLSMSAGKNQHRVGTFDLQDAGMSVRRSNEGAMQHPGECHIVDEAAGAGQEANVLDPPDRLADHPSSSRRRSSRS
jgi:hypothetical protein